MFDSFNKYRQLLFVVLIFCYGFGVFQKPIFETLHLLCHVPGIIFSDGELHSFQAHHEQNHQHQNLAKLNIQNDEEAPAPASQNEQELKKKIEIAETKSKNSILDQQHLLDNFQIILPFKSAFIEIQNPPPQRLS